ncbi:MAG: hypothetical protein ACUVS6_03120, partial [Anaerolineae bacterium]
RDSFDDRRANFVAALGVHLAVGAVAIGEGFGLLAAAKGDGLAGRQDFSVAVRVFFGVDYAHCLPHKTGNEWPTRPRTRKSLREDCRRFRRAFP